MSDWIHFTIYDNTVGEYARAALNLAGIFLVLLLTRRLFVSWLSRLAAKTPGDFDDFIVGLVGQIGKPVLFVGALYLSSLSLALSDRIRTPLRYLLIVTLTVQGTLILQKAAHYAVLKSYRRRAKPGDPAAEVVTRNLTLMLGWGLWVLGTVFILDNLGVNIGALVAGLGIGGVAVAMASQAVLGDLFSAFSIFIDKPFETGDFIIVDKVMGTVEYVGLKTTRLRSLSGEQIILANSDLTKSRVQNFKRMEARRVVFSIGIAYGTPIEKIRRASEILRSIIERIDGLRFDRAHLAAFSKTALEYEVVYFVRSADYNLYMDRQQQINFAILEAFESEGIELARAALLSLSAQ